MLSAIFLIFCLLFGRFWPFGFLVLAVLDTITLVVFMLCGGLALLPH